MPDRTTVDQKTVEAVVRRKRPMIKEVLLTQIQNLPPRDQEKIRRLILSGFFKTAQQEIIYLEERKKRDEEQNQSLVRAKADRLNFEYQTPYKVTEWMVANYDSAQALRILVEYESFLIDARSLGVQERVQRRVLKAEIQKENVLGVMKELSQTLGNIKKLIQTAERIGEEKYVRELLLAEKDMEAQTFVRQSENRWLIKLELQRRISALLHPLEDFIPQIHFIDPEWKTLPEQLQALLEIPLEREGEFAAALEEIHIRLDAAEDRILIVQSKEPWYIT